MQALYIIANVFLLIAAVVLVVAVLMQDGNSQGIGAVFLRHFQGVNAVAQGLGHLPPYLAVLKPFSARPRRVALMKS